MKYLNNWCRTERSDPMNQHLYIHYFRHFRIENGRFYKGSNTVRGIRYANISYIIFVLIEKKIDVLFKKPLDFRYEF